MTLVDTGMFHALFKEGLATLSLLKLSKAANPKPTYPASYIPSYGNHNKGSCPPSLPTPPSGYPYLLTDLLFSMWSCWAQCTPSSRTPWVTNCRFQRHPSPDLLASLYLNNNKVYALKPLLKVWLLYIAGLGALEGYGWRYEPISDVWGVRFCVSVAGIWDCRWGAAFLTITPRDPLADSVFLIPYKLGLSRVRVSNFLGSP